MPLIIEATADVMNMVPMSEQPESLRGRFRNYGSLAFSAVVHIGLLFVMGLFVLPATGSRHLVSILVFSTGQEDASDGLLLQDHALLFQKQDTPDFPDAVDISVPLPETNAEWPDLDIALIRPDLPAASPPEPLAVSTLLLSTSAESSSAASSLDEAVDRVSGSIRGKLREGDLLVVWLLDASCSMAEERRRLATQIESFLPRVDGGARTHHRLLNAVVSFGAAMKEHVAPTEVRAPISNSVRLLPVDASGKENVFAAIEQCVAKYRSNWPGKQLMIVVWTDESGDDATKLENTLRVCKDHGVSVSVVGPMAVLGADTGMYAFSHPQLHQPRQLPVKRGPDSALPERLDLGYWFLTHDPQTRSRPREGFGATSLPSWYGNDRNIAGHKCVAATEVALPSWYGDRDLKGLVSGFSPYALTRLASQTAGAYIVLDRSGEAGRFLGDSMGSYLPDYRSVEEYLQDVRSHPLRRAVMDAVRVTQNEKPGPPPMTLFGKTSKSPPYVFMRTYYPPAQFARQFKLCRRRLKAQADRATQIVEQALAHVSEPGSVENGLESDCERENSRRWRAWYDLTRGRLLATTVRLEEYRLACDRVTEPDFLRKTTNYLVFAPALEMKSDSKFHRRAEEAEYLLMRCVRENTNTPWAWLAQRELDYGLGINVRQNTLKPVTMPPRTPRQPRIPRL